jgi:hypothetical protein
MNVKHHWLWKLVFEDESALGWIIHLCLAFIIIKFLVYPLLGWILGTSYPIVSVVSCSMDHRGDFDGWWSSPSVEGTQAEFYSKYGITKEGFRQFPLKNGFKKGDLMVLRGAKDVQQGNVIVFFSQYSREPIIHRVVDREEGVLITKGDANRASDPKLDRAYDNQVLGKTLLRIPFAGWLKVGLIKGWCLIGGPEEVCAAQTC